MANAGIPFDISHELLRWNESISIVPEYFRAAESNQKNIALLINCLDLTSLKATDTPDSIEILLEKASPLTSIGSKEVAAVCVYSPFVEAAKNYLNNHKIRVATVAGGFPHGQISSALKSQDVAHCVESGADEVDIVINRTWPLTGQWELLYREVRGCKEAVGSSHLKVILATGELKEPHLIYKSAMVSMMAGADFVKTSTGMEAVNATLEAGYIMMRAIREYHQYTGVKVGIKPAGGIRKTTEALQWLALLEDMLGDEWKNPKRFRIGASSLLSDLMDQLQAL